MSSSIKLKNANSKTLSVTNSNANQTDKEVIYLNTVDELANASGSINAVAIVSDLSRGGTFEWSATGTANGGTVFAGISGYWNRQYSGAVNVKWFGAKGDGVTDDTTAVNSVISKNHSYFPSGTYIINSQVVFNGGIHTFDSATIKAGSSFPSDTDIAVVAGGASYLSTILERINIDCNRKGRDGLVVTNGNRPKIIAEISNSYRNGFSIVCGGYDWVENLIADISVNNAGAHGVYLEISSTAIGSFINESELNIEVRGVSQASNGGVGIYAINKGTVPGSSKISNINIPNINLDAGTGIATANGFTVGYNPIYLDYQSGATNSFEKWYINCGGFESTSGSKPIDSVNGLSNYFLYAVPGADTRYFDIVGALSYNWGDGYLRLNGDTHRYKSSKDYGDNGIYSAMYPANADQRILTVGKERKSLTRSTSSTEVDGAAIINYVNYNIPYGTGATVSGTKVGLKFTGASVGSVNKDSLAKSAALYWVNEDSGSAYNRAAGICIHTSASDQNNREVIRFGSDGHTKPPVTNVHNLGDSSVRWSNIYLVNAPNVSSDERLKTFYDIEESEILVAKELKSMVRKYKLNASIIEKGEDKARFHFGVSAQEVISVFTKYGLNPFNYSFVCKDIIPAKYEYILVKDEVVDKNGDILENAIYKKDRIISEEDYILSIRYEELICFIFIATM